MSVTSLMNQTMTIYGKSSYDSHGREVVGGGIDTRAHVQATTTRRLEANGQVITVSVIAYVPSGTVVETDDRVAYLSQQYKVYGKYEAVDGTGKTNHIKLELIKWREK